MDGLVAIFASEPGLEGLFLLLTGAQMLRVARAGQAGWGGRLGSCMRGCDVAMERRCARNNTPGRGFAATRGTAAAGMRRHHLALNVLGLPIDCRCLSPPAAPTDHKPEVVTKALLADDPLIRCGVADACGGGEGKEAVIVATYFNTVSVHDQLGLVARFAQGGCCSMSAVAALSHAACAVRSYAWLLHHTSAGQ